MTGWAVLAAVPACGREPPAVVVGPGAAAGASPSWRCSRGMPLLGTVVGAGLGLVASRCAVRGSAALRAILGVRELAEGRREGDEAGEGLTRLRRGVGPWGLLAGGVAAGVDEPRAASPRRRGVAAAHPRACPGAAGLVRYGGALAGGSRRRIATALRGGRGRTGPAGRGGGGRVGARAVNR